MPLPSTSSPLSAASSACKVSFVIPGVPVAWARPRFNHGRGFTAPKQKEAKTAMAWQIAMGWARPKVPVEQGVVLRVQFVFRAVRKKDIGTHRAMKPDVDNLMKMVADAAIGIVYEDDRQIVDISAIKLWGERSETRIEIGCV